MKNKSKILLSTILVLILSNNIARSQEIESFGLEGMNINDIKYYNGYLFAATDSGVYRRGLVSAWTHIGLEGKKVNVVYPHDVGPLDWTVTAGVSPKFTPGDSALIYCYCDGDWTIADSGINRNEITSIDAMDGFPSPVICGETFVAGNGKLFRRGIDTWYEEVFNSGIGIVNVVKTNWTTGDVWIGGETGIFAPYISKSTDLGETWMTAYPDLGGDNACNSIEFDKFEFDTNTVYAGMEGVVIKTTDGGATWNPTGLTNTPYYFYGMAFNWTFNLYAGGSTSSNEFGLFYSNDTENWVEVQTEIPIKGISSMISANVVAIPEAYTIFLGTFGDGVFKISSLPIDVDDKNNLLNKFSLFQNYPNPFNPTTNIKFRIANFGFVSLKIYDVLGREVATLVNEEKQPGEYEVEFDGSELASGIYFYQLKAGDFIETRKIILSK